MSDPINNHSDAGVERLIQQYKEKPSLEAILRSLIDQIQDAEDAYQQLLNFRSIDNAFGQTLDLIGSIVGATRLTGESDDNFRLRIRYQVSLNTSEGQPERVLDSYRLITGESFVLIQELYPAAVSVSSAFAFADQAEVDRVLAVVESVAPAGVRVDYLGVFDATEPFAFQGVASGAGFGTVTDANVGGKFAKIETRNKFFSFAGNSVTDEGFGTVKDPLVGGQLEG